MNLCVHTFDSCDCIVFRLHAKFLSTHYPSLAYCAIALNKFVKTCKHIFVNHMSQKIVMSISFRLTEMVTHSLWILSVLNPNSNTEMLSPS